jgi:hypothetical protein
MTARLFAAGTLALAVAVQADTARSTPSTTTIINARIVDGTGAPPRKGSVRVLLSVLGLFSCPPRLL